MGKKWEKKYWIKLWSKSSFFIANFDQTINFVCMLRNYGDLFIACIRARKFVISNTEEGGILCHWSRETWGLPAVHGHGEGWKEFPQGTLGWDAQGCHLRGVWANWAHPVQPIMDIFPLSPANQPAGSSSWDWNSLWLQEEFWQKGEVRWDTSKHYPTLSELTSAGNQ